MDEQQIRAQREKCFECGGQLQEVKLIDRGDANVHTGTVYAAVEAKRNKWTGEFPVEGRVLSFLCSHCGRIALYGAALAPKPSKDKEER
jgi:uncharacterized OB-fold protein